MIYKWYNNTTTAVASLSLYTSLSLSPFYPPIGRSILHFFFAYTESGQRLGKLQFNRGISTERERERESGTNHRASKGQTRTVEGCKTDGGCCNEVVLAGPLLCTIRDHIYLYTWIVRWGM